MSAQSEDAPEPTRRIAATPHGVSTIKPHSRLVERAAKVQILALPTGRAPG